ncbi:hypothetical protein [Paenibacillus alginolyticus]|uniref:Uncharacterized protein n=1 Tax=Paenibacillus alginolyticus TaxID=59839 RepID=A0ABT4GJE5_9BACL|nr:hypothetical protein [Paenibacillus alginolyticus]MCY9696159.1 hypothetical protein [Paenibacillus alginolyticus]MEC0143312.1 hypothetical protein [Paenibacillus alginolyticus]
MNYFYGDLNSDREENRWERWTGHRQEVTTFIGQSLPLLRKTDKMVILGVGNGDDLDFNYLCNLVHELTLVDIDKGSMEKCLSYIPVASSHKIQSLVECDLTGLDQLSYYDQISKLFKSQASMENIVQYLNEIKTQIKRLRILETHVSSYDVVMSSAVYTQIYYIQSLSEFAAYANFYNENEVQSITDAMKVLRDEIIIQYNKLMLSLVKNDGTVILWTDMVRTDQEFVFPEEEFYSLQSEEERIKLIYKMMFEHGREAAITGLLDLYAKLSPEGRKVTSWVWPFNNDRHYITMGLSGTKESMSHK